MRTNPKGGCECQSFIRAYPIRSGTANTTWCLSPSGDGRCCSGRSVLSWGRSFMPCPAEGMPDHRGASEAGRCAYVHCESPQAPGGLGDRVSEGEERDRGGPTVWPRTELYGRAPLGPGATPSRRSGSNWSKSANTSATKRKRMDRTGALRHMRQRRAVARRLNHQGNRL